MKKLAMAVLVLAVAFAVSAPAMAQQGRGQQRGGGGGRGAARLDTNGDGLISADEWVGREEVFDRLDADGDGFIDGTEMAQARQQVRERAGERGQQARRGQGMGAGRMGGQGMREGAGRGMTGPGGAGRPGQRIREAAGFVGGLFNLIDADADDRLSEAEIRQFARKIAAADADEDGYVTREEARETFRERVAEHVGNAFFERNDSNGDGVVTEDEFSGRPERFEQLDVNDDGVITSADFEERPGRGGRGREGEGTGGRGRGAARGMREGIAPRGGNGR